MRCVITKEEKRRKAHSEIWSLRVFTFITSSFFLRRGGNICLGLSSLLFPRIFLFLLPLPLLLGGEVLLVVRLGGELHLVHVLRVLALARDHQPVLRHQLELRAKK
jgi:hypothetical protein